MRILACLSKKTARENQSGNSYPKPSHSHGNCSAELLDLGPEGKYMTIQDVHGAFFVKNAVAKPTDPSDGTEDAAGSNIQFG